MKCGIQMVLTVPALGIEVRYEPYFHTFAFIMPYDRYVNNTEGICGVCNNVPGDEFLLRNGSRAGGVAEFMADWQRNRDDDCELPVNPTEPPCPKRKTMCDKLYKYPFDDCHSVENPAPYYESCLYDDMRAVCGVDGSCEALAFYAQVCSMKGICLQWRGDDVCPPENCTAGMVYRECAPVCMNAMDVCNPEVCTLAPARGCFCPEETYEKNGRCCSCEVCTPPEPPQCSEGQIIEIQIIETDDCCPDIHYLCVCASECPPPPTCAPDYDLVHTSDDLCCPRYECAPHGVKCKVIPMWEEPRTIYIMGCESALPVSLVECDGRCSSRTIWSIETASMETTCTCCQPSRTEFRTFDLVNCGEEANNNSTYTYEHILDCTCVACQIPLERDIKNV
uniref:Mucin-5B-like n=1 Tax=Saccoglossus kowalevskii TaxID=10224 RepID=A0ABM0MK15_SACKO|nr:PREDICTED: mucin-5B-like [Saccoglossus kowalevskii]